VENAITSKRHAAAPAKGPRPCRECLLELTTKPARLGVAVTISGVAHGLRDRHVASIPNEKDPRFGGASPWFARGPGRAADLSLFLQVLRSAGVRPIGAGK
jgi:hypothetical protein